MAGTLAIRIEDTDLVIFEHGEKSQLDNLTWDAIGMKRLINQACGSLPSVRASAYLPILIDHLGKVPTMLLTTEEELAQNVTMLPWRNAAAMQANTLHLTPEE